jgi:hypothetical protein
MRGEAGCGTGRHGESLILDTPAIKQYKTLNQMALSARDCLQHESPLHSTFLTSHPKRLTVSGQPALSFQARRFTLSP